jgi:hypothetical protein
MLTGSSVGCTAAGAAPPCRAAASQMDSREGQGGADRCRPQQQSAASILSRSQVQGGAKRGEARCVKRRRGGSHATVLMMSATVQPRDRSLTGLARP